jgi:uncharacterized protein
MGKLEGTLAFGKLQRSFQSLSFLLITRTIYYDFYQFISTIILAGFEMRESVSMDYDGILSIVKKHYPHVLGIYLFGSYGTEEEGPDSDLDLSLLLTPEEARREKSLAYSICKDELESIVERSVDLINLREANAVFQNEIITEGKLIYCSNPAETDTFEMLVLSAYQKLNEERAAILNDILISGRVLQ